MTASAAGATGSGGPGTVLGGRYRLDDLLSETEGARFWRGTDTVLGRNVAIHAVPTDDPRAEDLLGAARLSATVSDARLLRVLDCDSADGISWVVNEWGDGLSLDLVLERDVLPPARAAWLAREVAETIANAHAHGVTHGRLNPEAVLVTHAGAVKLIGFVVDAALIRPTGAHEPAPGHPGSPDGGEHAGRPHGLHRPGSVGGAHAGPWDPSASADPAAAAADTAYDRIDARERDVIDLASILYAGLVGRWPGLSLSRVPGAPRDARGPLRPRQVRAGVPRMLDAICERVLRREAHEHMLPIETAHEIAAALDDYVGDPGANAPANVAAMHSEPMATALAVPRHPVTGNPITSPSSEGAETQAGAPIWDDDTTAPPAPAAGHETDGTPLASAAHRPVPHEPVRPLPPYEEPPDRPLFASTEPRRPASPPPGATESTGAAVTATGAAPPPPASPTPEPGSEAWLFGDQPLPPPPPPRHWSRWALLVGSLVVLVVAMVVAFKLGTGDGSTAADRAAHSSGPSQRSTPTERASVLSPVAVSDFDPEADPSSENPEEVPRATDGNPATGWTTMTYQGDSHLGNLKDGVGLVFDLGADHAVGSVEVLFTGTPTTFSVYAAPAGSSTPPDAISAVHRVDGMVARRPHATLRFDHTVRTRFLVLWLTDLPPANGGYRAQVDEVSILS